VNGTCANYRLSQRRGSPQIPVLKLGQNPSCLGRRKLPFERKQLPQVVDIRHTSIASMERLKQANILRNQQVAGSIPAGGSSSASAGG